MSGILNELQKTYGPLGRIIDLYLDAMGFYINDSNIPRVNLAQEIQKAWLSSSYWIKPAERPWLFSKDKHQRGIRRFGGVLGLDRPENQNNKSDYLIYDCNFQEIEFQSDCFVINRGSPFHDLVMQTNGIPAEDAGIRELMKVIYNGEGVEVTLYSTEIASKLTIDYHFLAQELLPPLIRLTPKFSTRTDELIRFAEQHRL